MKTKKFLSFALVLAMLAGMLPGMSLTASAAGNTTEITPTNTSGTMTITLTIAYNVSITAGDHMTKTAGSDDAEQTGLTGAMTDVVYTADDGYYFPTDYSVAEVNGITVTRNSYTQITVSGTPTADAAITLTAPTAKTTPNAPTTAAATDCTTADNNDGKLTGVTTAMEYKKSDAEDWTAGTGSDITGLVPGTYYVRVKATDTTNASGNQELTIADYLSVTKTAAKADLDTLQSGKNQDDYDAADWTTLTQAITDGKTAIDNATTTEAVTTAKNNAVDAVNAVKTKAQKALDNAKTTAKNDLDTLQSGKNQNDYDAADWTTLTQAITDGKTAIDNATTTEAVTTAKNNVIDAVNAVKTKAQKALDNAKTTAKNDLDTLQSGKNQNDYDAADWTTLTQAITDGKTAIDNATTTEAVTTAKNNVIDAVNAVKTKAQKALDNAKTSAVNTVNAVNANDYIAADQQTVTDAKTTALAAIEAATTEEEVTTALNNFNNAIASCTTQVVADQIAQVMSEVSAKTGSDMTYTGSPIQLINTPTTALPAGYTMKYAVTTENVKPTDESLYTTSIPTKTNARTYYVWYKVVGDSNHNDTEPASVTVAISMATPTLTEPTLGAVTYDPSKTLADVALTGGWTWVTDTTVPTVGNAGYMAENSVDDANYDYTGVEGYDATTHKVTRTLTLTVNKATVNEPTIESKTYNAQNQTADVATSDLYTVTTNNGGTEAGDYNVVLALTDAANYKWSDSDEAEKTLIFSIAKATNNTVSVSIESWTYGDAANAPTAASDFGTQVITYAVKDSGQFTNEVPTDAGDYTVKATVAETASYEGGEATKNFTIAKKAATITADAKSKTYGDADPELTATVEGTVGSDTLNYTLNRAEGNNFGEYDITVTLGENPNYNITTAGAKLTIGKRALTVTTKNQSIYVGQNIPDWTAESYTVEGLVGEDTVDVTVEYWKDDAKVEELDKNKAGTYTIKPIVTAGDNYEVNAIEGKLTINYYPAPSTYAPAITQSENGTVALEPEAAEAGEKVTVKVTPDEGYKLDELTVKDASGKEIELTKNEDGTYSFTQPSGKVTVEAKYAKEVKFADVPENSYYADAVDWAVEKGITNGVDKTHFAPDATCTRAQAVTFLWRALGCPEPTATKSEFTDVTDANAFYYKAVLWATENGVTNGIGDGSFGVNGIVNRAQMVTFMARALNGKATTAESFADVPEGAYFTDAAAWAKENGISNGIGGNKFGSNENCARAQIVTMLYRYFVK